MSNNFPHRRPSKFIFTLAFVASACVCLAVWGIDAHEASANGHDAASAPAQERADDVETAAVYGRAVYEGTNRPVRRAKIILLSAEGRGPEHSGLTNARGEFRIKKVPAGRYFPALDTAGVISPVSFVTLEEMRAGGGVNTTEIGKHFEEIETDGKTDKEVTVRVRRGAAVSGKVTYADGDPAVGVLVHVMRRGDGRLAKFLTSINRSVLAGLRTDDRGVFRVSGLPPGEYVVAASEAAEHGDEGRSNRDDYMSEGLLESLSNQHLLMTYHPSATSSKEATAISVEAGDEREGVDITIAERATRTITGVVRARRDKRPVANAKITIVRKDEDSGLGAGGHFPYGEFLRNGVETDAEGRWQLRDIPDGRYTIFINPQDEYEPSGVSGNMSVSTGSTTYGPQNMNGTITNANVSVATYTPPRRVKRYPPVRKTIEVSGDVGEFAVELGEGGRVSGTVTVEDGKQSPSYGQVYAMRVAQDPEDSAADSSPSASTYGGQFTIEGMTPGKFFLHATHADGSEAGGLYVRSITWRGKDLLREPLDIAEGTSVEGVRVVYSANPATLEVRVTSPAGTRAEANSHVLLLPADAPGWSPYTQQLYCSTLHRGTCRISAPPGDYLVITLSGAAMEPGAFEGEIRRRAAAAPRVALRGGETKTVEAVAPER